MNQAKKKQVMLFCIFIAAAAGVYVYAVKPAIARIQVLKRVLPEKTAQLDELKTKSKQYLEIKTELDKLKTDANVNKKNFQLVPFLESTLNRDGLSGNITTMKPKTVPLDENYSETIVEVGMENITLDKLVNLLVQIEASDHFMKIKSLYTKKSTVNPKLLDTVIQISTLKSGD